MKPGTKKLKYPIGIQTFEKIIEEGYVYVDKTDLIFELVSTGQNYFLSRPRRFGKSLLLSTIQAYFEGKKELFDGLLIFSLEQSWEKFPVIHLDLSAYNPNEPNHLHHILDTQISRYEQEYGIKKAKTSPDQRFNRLIYEVYQKTGQRVVVLIDEYDAPLTSHILDSSSFNYFRNLLRSLYSNLKSMDEYLKFVMLTGVTRFSKTSVFSGLNNLEDISFDDTYSTICGITEDELKTTLLPGVTELGRKVGLSEEEMLKTLKFNYDGYHFTSNCIDIYNPFSILQAFKKNKVGMYWYQSGKSTLIVDLFKDSPYLLSKELNQSVGENLLADIDIAAKSPTALMFQAGYLTIKTWDAASKMFTLGIPNHEVKEGLYMDLASSGLEVGPAMLSTHLGEIRNLLMKGNPIGAFERLKSFLAKIPYLVTQNKPEIYYENNLFIILSLIGIDTEVEWHTSEGRIDMLLKFSEYLYIIELKLDGSAKEALNQIESNNYSLPFLYDGRKIIKVGINFSSISRNITDIEIAPIEIGK